MLNGQIILTLTDFLHKNKDEVSLMLLKFYWQMTGGQYVAQCVEVY